MTTEEKIKELENSCRTAMEEIEKLKAELAKEENKKETIWEPREENETYLSLNSNGCIEFDKYCIYSEFHKGRVNMNAVFKPNTKIKHLEWYRDNVIRVQNKLMQLHELLCPDYFPDWMNSYETKYYLVYSTKGNEWTYTDLYIISPFVVYFTEESVQKACEILNREKFMMQ